MYTNLVQLPVREGDDSRFHLQLDMTTQETNYLRALMSRFVGPFDGSDPRDVSMAVHTALSYSGLERLDLNMAWTRADYIWVQTHDYHRPIPAKFIVQPAIDDYREDKTT